MTAINSGSGYNLEMVKMAHSERMGSVDRNIDRKDAII